MTEDIEPDFYATPLLGNLECVFRSVIGPVIDARYRSLVSNGHAIGNSACSPVADPTIPLSRLCEIRRAQAGEPARGYRAGEDRQHSFRYIGDGL